MPTLDVTPGLSAWQYRRRIRRRRTVGFAILATGFLGAALFVVPPQFNPLVTAGVLAVEPPPLDVQIPHLTTAIPIRDADLPTLRPTTSTMLESDRSEAAFIARHMPQRKAAPVVEEPDDAPRPGLGSSGIDQPTTAIVVQPQLRKEQPAKPASAQPQSANSRPSAARTDSTTGPNENFTELKKRAFSNDR